MYTFQFRSIYEYIPLLWEAARITLSLSVTAIVLSLALGCVLAVMRRSGSSFARGISLAYIEVMRNTPLLVILYLVYFGLPATGLRLSSYTAALIGLTLNSAGYMAEIVRSGLVAVAKGQFESARSQGFTSLQLYRHIVMPQVFRTIYISLGNQFISVILASSLASTIAVEDVASWMQTTGSISFRFFETFLISALVYLVLCQFVNVLRLGVGYWLFADQRARR